MKEIVFEILAEGGGLKIERERNGNEERFIYHHDEMDFSDQGLDISEKGVYENFEQPFQLINSKYHWFALHLSKLHEDFRDYVLFELINILNKKGVTPDELFYSKKVLEERLNIELEFGNAPVRNGLLNIKVKNLVELTEYDYDEFLDEYAQEIGQKFKLRGKYKIWTEEQAYNRGNMEIMNVSNSFKTIGKLEVSGNTIVIKNEFEQIEYAFPSDKYFVSTTPVLSKSKCWFYNDIF